MCGPKAHDCVGVFPETERPGIWADLGNLAREHVDLANLLVYNVHIILMMALTLDRLAGQSLTTTVMMWSSCLFCVSRASLNPNLRQVGAHWVLIALFFCPGL